MKKFLLLAMLIMAAGMSVNAQQVRKVDAKTYEVVSQRKSSSNGVSYVPTDIKLKDGDTIYTVYKHTFTRGKRTGETAFFIQKVSKKTGKLYWKEVKLED